MVILESRGGVSANNEQAPPSAANVLELVSFQSKLHPVSDADGLWPKPHSRSAQVPFDIFLFGDIFIGRFVRNLREVWTGKSLDEMFLLELDVGQVLGRSWHSRNVPLAKVRDYKANRENQPNKYITELSFGPA